MPRPENPVDARDGPLTAFARELRALRALAGSPSYRALARRAGFSASTLSVAASGRVLPSLDVALAYAQACGGDPVAWRRRWHEVTHLMNEPVAGTAADASAPAQLPPRAAGQSQVPRQLPRAVRRFSGRTRELAELTGLLLGEPGRPGAQAGICVVVGAGGMGKTALSVHWAHAHAHRFPDGQLFVNLRGYDPTTRPQTVGEALRGILVALGVAPGAIPDGDEERGALYRSLVAERRALVLLDDARDSGQAAALLPGGGRCAVLVTSRLRLEGLAAGTGAVLLELGSLPDDEAELLLAGHAGGARLALEPEATSGLLASCAGLPLALSVTAARIAGHPEFPLAELAEELRDEAARLDALDSVDRTMSLRAVLACSHRALTAPAATTLALLGLVPGTEIGLAAAAGLLGESVPRTRTLLRDLETAHLVLQPRPGRYRMHDLVRIYAGECARGELADDVRDAASARLLDHYVHTARTGEKVLRPFSEDLALDPPADGSKPTALTDPAAALSWFETEHACLLAVHRSLAASGADRASWHLAWALDTFHYRRALRSEGLEVWCAALAAAERARDEHGMGLAHRYLGRALSGVGRHEQALWHLGASLALSSSGGGGTGSSAAGHIGAGDRAALAHTELNFGWALELAGDDRGALTHCLRALDLFRVLGDSLREAVALNAVGWYQAQLGRPGEARECCELALALNRRHGNRAGEASTLDSLGRIAHHLGRFEEAALRYRETLAIYRELGNEYSEADTLSRLGEAYEACGRFADAVEAWGWAYDLYDVQYRTADAERARQVLDRVRAHLHVLS